MLQWQPLAGKKIVSLLNLHQGYLWWLTLLLHVKILISESEKQCQSTEVLLPTLSVKLSLTSPSHTFSPSFPSTTVLMTLQQEKSNIFFFLSPALYGASARQQWDNIGGEKGEWIKFFSSGGWTWRLSNYHTNEICVCVCKCVSVT